MYSPLLEADTPDTHPVLRRRSECRESIHHHAAYAFIGGNAVEAQDPTSD